MITASSLQISIIKKRITDNEDVTNQSVNWQDDTIVKKLFVTFFSSKIKCRWIILSGFLEDVVKSAVFLWSFT